LALLDDLTNFATLGDDQTLTGQNTFVEDVTFEQDILMGDCTIGNTALGYLNLSAGGVNEMQIDPHFISASGRLNVVNDGVNSGNISVDGSVTAGDDITATGNMSAQSFNTTSDRNAKEKFTPINSSEVLQRVASLPICSWNFKSDEQTRHIGPMAQDFYAAFNVGTDDKHIATVDEGGVALAAIQGLNEKLKAKDAQIKGLEKRLFDLEQLVKTSAQK